MLLVFILTIVIFVLGGLIIFRFMESNLWTAIIIAWFALMLTYTIGYIRSDQPKSPFLLGFAVAIILVLIHKGLLHV
jgi:hydrogenase/urease accessory protein HupE